MTRLAAERIFVELSQRPVLRDVSFALNGSGLTAIIGPNGAGKSTLLRALAGLLALKQGSITLNEKSLMESPRGLRAKIIGYLPQHHAAAWAMPVADVVGLGRIPWSRKNTTIHAQAIQNAMRAMDVLDFAERPMTALSGGERSRVMLARLLAGEHAILLCDEPLAHTDPRHQLLVMEILRARADTGQAVAVVMHDLALAARYAARIVVMNEGRIIADGAPSDILTQQLLQDVFGIGSLVEQRNDGFLVTSWS